MEITKLRNIGKTAIIAIMLLLLLKSSHNLSVQALGLPDWRKKFKKSTLDKSASVRRQ